MRRNFLSYLHRGTFFTFLSLALSYPVVEGLIESRNMTLANTYTSYTRIEDAMKDLEEERRLMGLQDHHIFVAFDDIHHSASSQTLDDSVSVINLGRVRNKGSLKHEMYHIRETLRGGVPFWRTIYPFSAIEEWKATSYAFGKD